MTDVAIRLPLDGERFVRRACPACEREFKWLWAENEDVATDPDPRGYCCPYCGAWAATDQWFTQPQVDYIKAAAMGPVMDEADEIFSSMTSLRYEPGERPPPPADLPPEPDDMRRVEFRCHPEDPLKVEEVWSGQPHCLICGIKA